MKTKLDKAHKILIESGWIRDYYFIKKVMNGNMNSTMVVHETSTRKWGLDALERKLLKLKEKHPKLKGELSRMTYWYYDNISDFHDKVLSNIFDNMENSKKVSDTNAAEATKDAIYYADL